MNVMRGAFLDSAAPVAANADDVERDWFTAAELAELQLAGLPGDKRSINRRAREENWLLRSDSDGEPLSRPRIGRGGGTEFHVSLLPGPARIDLARRGLCAERPVPVLAELPAASGWRWYECQSAKTKAEAERRTAIVAEIEMLESSGMTRSAAVAETARSGGIGKATLWGWLKLVAGVAASDRLPALAPRFRGGGREADIDADLWAIYKGDVLRLSQATLTSCYDRVVEIATDRGLLVPSEATLRRRLKAEIPASVWKLRREGEEALRRSIPSQRRTVADLHALQCVNIDGHKFDVFVTPPGGGKPVRPIMVAIQDVYSRKVLAWRLDLSETAVLTRLAFADLFEKYGIPAECVLDNGRAFASKWITGGTPTRFRFKVKPEEPTGLLTGLGIKIHFALPYRGQSKPIERGFRDMCDRIARHPAMEGAYCGNNPMAKPENYGSRAIGWDAFVAHVDRGIASHNAKLGRRTEMARGRSFDDVFAESYAAAPIGKATAEQMRMALLAAEQVRIDSRTGEVKLYGNRYWSHGCSELHGQLVTARFDPDDLMRDLHLYGLDGRYLTSAQIIADTGFLDVAGAKTAGKRWADYRKRIRDAAEAEELMTAEQVAARQVHPIEPALPEPAVIRPVRHRGNTAAALKVTTQAVRAQRDEVEDKISAAIGKHLRAVE